MSFHDLDISEVKPPTIRKQAGRPRTTRLRKGQSMVTEAKAM
jgi:hypothetical protein